MIPMSIYWPVSFAVSAPSRESVYRRVRFPGICEFARAYGYHYTSVYKHLTGQRTSLTMAAKWAAWQAGKSSEFRAGAHPIEQ